MQQKLWIGWEFWDKGSRGPVHFCSLQEPCLCHVSKAGLDIRQMRDLMEGSLPSIAIGTTCSQQIVEHWPSRATHWIYGKCRESSTGLIIHRTIPLAHRAIIINAYWATEFGRGGCHTATTNWCIYICMLCNWKYWGHSFYWNHYYRFWGGRWDWGFALAKQALAK
jgi:hypothetical protein